MSPSAAAELAVPDMSVIISYLNSADKNLNEKIREKINKYYQLLDFSEKRLNSLLPCKKIENSKKILLEKESRLGVAMKNKISMKKMILSERFAALDNLSPLKIMNRGYSIVYSNEKIINSVSQLEKGDNIEIRLSDGMISAVVE